MARPSARQLLAELLPVLLVLLCLAGGLVLVVATHRRFPAQTRVETTAQAPPAPAPAPVEPPTTAASEPPEQPAPQPPPPDPTEPILADLARQTADQRALARQADQRVLSSETALASVRSQLQRLSRQDALIKARASRLNRYADALEREADLLARHRDVLAQKLKQENQEFARLQARSKDSYAVLPYRGENGTWRRPIPIECRDGTAKIQPDGRTYSMLELADSLSLRGSPIVADVAREIIKAAGDTPPDGARVIPYILFVIRPGGVRAYYEARGQLEQLGIAFGYELVADDMPIDYPADDPSRWSDSEPAPGDILAQGGSNAASNPYVWPQTPPSPSGRGGIGTLENDPIANGGSSPPRNPFGRSGTPGPGIDLEALARRDRQRAEASGSGGRRGPFPTIPDGPPINYVPDPRPLARQNSLSGNGYNRAPAPSFNQRRNGVGYHNLARGSHPSGEAGAPFEPGSSGTRSAQGLSPDGLSLTPVPPSSSTGARGGSQVAQGESPWSGASSGTASGRRSGPFPSSPSTGNSARSGGGSTLAGRSTRSSGGSGRPSNSSSSPPSGLSGGMGTPSDASPGSTRLGGVTGGNPLGAVIARALANGRGGGGRLHSPSDTASSASGGGQNGQALAPNSGQGGSSGNSQSADSGSLSGSGSGGSSGGTGSPGMVSTLSHPDPRMNDKILPITIACDRSGILIQPGGYRLSLSALEKNHLLHDRLHAILDRARKDAHGQPVKPRVLFVIEPGGEETFWMVRRQTVFSGTDWPATVRLVESGGLDALSGSLRR